MSRIFTHQAVGILPMSPIAIIFGVAGQDGSYLAEFLLNLGYEVIGVGRRELTDYPSHVVNLAWSPKFTYEVSDVTDPSAVFRLFAKYNPQQAYNLAGQSNVEASFNNPNSTFRTNTESCLNILECIKTSHRQCRFFQASSTEIYGSKGVKNENSECTPMSPYGISKHAAHRLVDLYRSKYDLFCVSGITGNHESIRRPPNYVTKKIASYVGKLGRILARKGVVGDKLVLGNLEGDRDFGYAPDFVRGFHSSLTYSIPQDYVFATGISTTVRELCQHAFLCLNIPDWGAYVTTSEKYCRPVDFVKTVGDSSRAYECLGWKNTVDIKQIMQMMVAYETQKEN